MMFLRLLSLGVATLLLAGCSLSETGQSSLLPKNSVVVTTSPSIAIAPCETLRVDRFTSTNTFESGGKTYTLLGVEAEKISDEKARGDFFAFLQQKAFCIKEDPAFRGRNLVYLFTAENGLMNGEVLRRGLGRATRTGDYIYKEYLINLEEEAQSNKLGLWSNPERLAEAQKNPPLAEDSSSSLLIFPDSAARHGGETVTLRLRVGSIGKTPEALYLNSEEDYTSEANVPVVISLPANAKTQALVARAENLVGQSIDATGTVRMVGDRAQLLVEADSDVQVTK